MAHRGRRRFQQASVESSDAPTYEENLVERLARSLERNGFSGVNVDQAHRLGAVGFDGSTNPMVALSWLDDTEKILDEGIQCLDEDRVRITGFLLGGSARKWWACERTRKRHTWAQFKTAFHIEFCPPAFVETKRLEFETLTHGSMTVSEYERRFRELSNFYPNLVVDEVSAGRQDISRGTTPIEDSARLESRNQVLSSSGLVSMEDWIHRQGRPRVVPLAWDNSLHQRLEAGDREDDHLLEAEFML